MLIILTRENRSRELDPELDNYKIITLLDITEGHKCGGCTSHARECGADVGIFLRIRECIIVIHSKVTRGEATPGHMGAEALLVLIIGDKQFSCFLENS